MLGSAQSRIPTGAPVMDAEKAEATNPSASCRGDLILITVLRALYVFATLFGFSPAPAFLALSTWETRAVSSHLST